MSKDCKSEKQGLVLHSTSNDVLLLLIDSSFNMYFTFYAKKNLSKVFFCKCFKVFFSKKNISNGFTTEVKEFRWQLKTQSAPRLDFASRKQKNWFWWWFFFSLRFSKEGVFGLFRVCIFFIRSLCLCNYWKKSNCSDCLQRNLD